MGDDKNTRYVLNRESLDPRGALFHCMYSSKYMSKAEFRSKKLLSMYRSVRIDDARLVKRWQFAPVILGDNDDMLKICGAELEK